VTSGVFKKEKTGLNSLLKYYSLWLGIMLASFILVDVFAKTLNLGLTLTGLTKIIVDLCLFFASYSVQKKWVFK